MATKEIRAESQGIAVDGSGIGNQTEINVNHTAKFGSLLNPLLEKIIENYDPDAEHEKAKELPEPEEKLKFNDVNVFSYEIIENIGFLSLVEEIVDAIDDASPGSKRKFLRAIHQNYQNQKKQILIKNKINITDKASVIDTVRASSDAIIQAVFDSILSYAATDLYLHSIEDVRDSINLIVCYGFINCKILERPGDYE